MYSDKKPAAPQKTTSEPKPTIKHGLVPPTSTSFPPPPPPPRPKKD